MLAVDCLSHSAPRPARQGGMAAVEMALVALIFFVLLFGVVEFARAMYLINTLAEVTRRAAAAAANTDFSNSTALDDLRKHAIFDASSGILPLSGNVPADAIRIDYMSVQRESDGSFSMVAIPPGTLPSSPSANRTTCLRNPYADTCIRLVRVRVCDPGTPGTCKQIPFQGLVPLVNMSFPLPMSTTVARAESLGLVNGG